MPATPIQLPCDQAADTPDILAKTTTWMRRKQHFSSKTVLAGLAILFAMRCCWCMSDSEETERGADKK